VFAQFNETRFGAGEKSIRHRVAGILCQVYVVLHEVAARRSVFENTRHQRWQISRWARNVFNKEYFSALSAGAVFGAGDVAGSIGDPRTYGATLRRQF
jgi:outer membrane receptor protein involved in Fe transport